MPRGAGSSRGGKKRRSDEAFAASAAAAPQPQNHDTNEEEPAATASRGNKKKAKTSTSSTSSNGDGSAAAGVARRPAAPEAPNENPNDDNHNNNSNSNDLNDYDPFMVALLQHYVDHFSSGNNPPPPLQQDKAQAILQVCAGNRTMAAQLYWDDYFATTHNAQASQQNQASQNQNNQNQARANQNPSPPAAGQQQQVHLEAAAEDNRNHNHHHHLNFDLMDMNLYHDDTTAFDLSSSSRRGIRRSLDAAFGRVAGNNDSANNNDSKPKATAKHSSTGSSSKTKTKKKKKHTKKQPPSSSNSSSKKNMVVIDPRIRQAAARVAAQVWAHKEKENGDPESSRKQNKRSHNNSKDQLLQELEQEYSDLDPTTTQVLDVDNEWWQQPAHPTTATALLWGHPQKQQDQNNDPSNSNNEDPKTSTSTAVVEDATSKSMDDNEDNDQEEQEEKKKKDKAKQDEPNHKQDSHSHSHSSNSSDEEDDMEEDDDDDNDESSSSSSSHSSSASQPNQENQDQTNQEPPAGIPHTWMHASFSLSECTTGLVAKAPKLEDVELFVWRQQQHSSRQIRLSVPPPYHCRSVTAVLSAVTCLLYTGCCASHSASHNQANVVVTTCTSTQTPWLQLSPDERKRQFEARLAEAITALLATAAVAARRRHAYAYQKAQILRPHSVEELQKMKQRLHLVPTCRWETPPSAALVNEANGPLYQNVTLVTSWTHIQDLKSYVVSSMDAFTGPGGVALLLETVARIHGNSVLKNSIKSQSLIHCTCCERSKRHYETNPLTPSERNDTHNYLDTSVAPSSSNTETENGDCIAADSLLRLLLTGQVTGNENEKKEWSWSTGGMEFGLLTNNSNTRVGWQLARPNQPVWMVQGESSGYYSVLALDDDSTKPFTKEQRTAVARLDQPGSVLQLVHWNGWYDGRKVGMRLRTAQRAWKAPNHKLKLDPQQQQQQQQQKPNMVDWMNEKRRTEERIRATSAREHAAAQEMEPSPTIRPEEIESCQAHPDDVKFYPDNFCMWRFDVPEMKEEEEEENNDPEKEDKKPRGKHWTPYRRLTERQQRIVQTKLGPKIQSILWTRWPKATIDHFEPKDKVPLV